MQNETGQSEKTDPQLLKEIREAILHRRPIKRPFLTQLIRSNDDDVFECLMDVFLSHPKLLSESAYDAIAERVTEGLLARTAGTLSYPRCDVLDAIRLLFRRLWSRRDEFLELLNQLKSGLAKLLAGWPEAQADQVVLVIMEHLFADDDIRAFFGDFRRDPALAPAYWESSRLAGKA